MNLGVGRSNRSGRAKNTVKSMIYGQLDLAPWRLDSVSAPCPKSRVIRHSVAKIRNEMHGGRAPRGTLVVDRKAGRQRVKPDYPSAKRSGNTGEARRCYAASRPKHQYRIQAGARMMASTIIEISSTGRVSSRPAYTLSSRPPLSHRPALSP